MVYDWFKFTTKIASNSFSFILVKFIFLRGLFIIRCTHLSIRIFFRSRHDFDNKVIIFEESKERAVMIIARRGGHMPQPQKSVHMNGLLLCFLHVLVHKIWLNATGFALFVWNLCAERDKVYVYWLISCCFWKNSLSFFAHQLRFNYGKLTSINHNLNGWNSDVLSG